MGKEWKPGEFEQRTAELLEQEKDSPLQWWWLSFAEDGRGFLGGVLVQANGFISARLSLPLHGITSPGGQCAGWPLPDEFVPPDKYRNRLLSKAEVVEMWPDAKSLNELEG